MALRKILNDKDPALHKVCKPVVNFDGRLHKLLDDMRDTLLDSGGVGFYAIVALGTEQGLSLSRGFGLIGQSACFG